MTEAEITLSAGLFQLKAEQLHHCPPENVDVIYYFTRAANELPEMRIAARNIDHNAIAAEVSADSHRMLEKIMPEGIVREKDFQGWFAAAAAICPSCRFYHICHPPEESNDLNRPS